MTVDYRVVPADLTIRATSGGTVQLQLFNGTAALALTNYGTVELWLKDNAGGTSMTNNLTGKIALNQTPTNAVAWSPGTADLVAGSAPYQAYFRIWIGANKWFYVPEGNEFTVNVRGKY